MSDLRAQFERFQDGKGRPIVTAGDTWRPTLWCKPEHYLKFREAYAGLVQIECLESSPPIVRVKRIRWRR